MPRRLPAESGRWLPEPSPSAGGAPKPLPCPVAVGVRSRRAGAAGPDRWWSGLGVRGLRRDLARPRRRLRGRTRLELARLPTLRPAGTAAGTGPAAHPAAGTARLVPRLLVLARLVLGGLRLVGPVGRLPCGSYGRKGCCGCEPKGCGLGRWSAGRRPGRPAPAWPVAGVGRGRVSGDRPGPAVADRSRTGAVLEPVTGAVGVPALVHRDGSGGGGGAAAAPAIGPKAERCWSPAGTGNSRCVCVVALGLGASSVGVALAAVRPAVPLVRVHTERLEEVLGDIGLAGGSVDGSTPSSPNFALTLIRSRASGSLRNAWLPCGEAIDRRTSGQVGRICGSIGRELGLRTALGLLLLLLAGVLLLGHADRALLAAVHELPDDRLGAGQQLAGADRTSPGASGRAGRCCPAPCGRCRCCASRSDRSRRSAR